MYAYVLLILRQSVKEIVTTYNEILADYSADFGVYTFIRDARYATVAMLLYCAISFDLSKVCKEGKLVHSNKFKIFIIVISVAPCTCMHAWYNYVQCGNTCTQPCLFIH